MKAELTMTATVTLILFFVVFLVMGGFLVSLSSKYGKEANIEECRNSIALAKRLELLKGSIPHNFIYPYQCPSVFTKLEGTSKQIAQKVYYELDRCWYKTGGLDSGLGIRERLWIGKSDSTVALVCGEFEVENDLYHSDFADWISDKDPKNNEIYANKIQGAIGSQDNTHFLVSLVKDRSSGNLLVGPLEKLTPGIRYLVVYFFQSNSVWSKQSRLRIPQDWPISSQCENNDNCRFMFIIKENDWTLIDADIPYWDAEIK